MLPRLLWKTLIPANEILDASAAEKEMTKAIMKENSLEVAAWP